MTSRLVQLVNEHQRQLGTGLSVGDAFGHAVEAASLNQLNREIARLRARLAELERARGEDPR